MLPESPIVRNDLVYNPDPEREGYYKVKDPIRGEYFEFNELQVELMQSLDGSRSPREVASFIEEEFGVRIPVRKVNQFIQRLATDALLELDTRLVDTEQARKEILKLLRKRGLVFRARPRDEEREEGVLFSQGMEQILRKDPSRAIGYFQAVLELNPSNRRAREILDAIHRGYLASKSYHSHYKKHYPLWNPDRFLTRVNDRFGRYIYRKGTVAVIVFCILALLFPVIEILTRDVIFVSSFGAGDVLAVILVICVQAFVHEVLGHGLALKHYGGDVERVGVMLFFFVSPAFYCDTTDVHRLSRGPRVVVFLGGIMAAAPLAMTVWYLVLVLDPEVPGWNGLLLGALGLVGSLYTNLNPLVPLDGYYALSSWLQEIGLRARSFWYLKRRAAMRLFGVKSAVPEPDRRTRRRYLCYGICAAIYTPVFFLVAWVYFFLPLLVEHLGLLGLLLAAAFFVRMVGLKLGAVFLRLFLFVWRERRTVLTPARAAVMAIAVVAITVALLMRWPLAVHGHVVVEPQQVAKVRALEAGVVESVLVSEGVSVEAGQTLVVLTDPELERQRIHAAEALEIARTELTLLQKGASPEERAHVIARRRAKKVWGAVEAARLRQKRRLHAMKVESSGGVLQAQGDAVRAAGMMVVADAEVDLMRAGTREEELAAAEASTHFWEARLAELDDQLERMRINSPVAGTVVGYDPQQLVGRRVTGGDLLFEVHDRSGWRARMVPVRGEPLDGLEVGQDVSLRLFANPHEYIRGSVEELLAPQDESVSLVVSVAIDSPPNADWHVGMTGRAKVYGEPRRLVYRLLVVPIIWIVDYEFWKLFWD